MASLRPRSTARQLGLLTRLLATCTVAGSLVAGLALPAVALLGISAKRTVQDFNDGFSAFTVPAMSQPSQIYDADGGLIATVFDRNRVVVPGNRMAPVMRRAIVDIEDYRFYQHGAVDPKGVLRALYKNASSDGISQGASTLTQQFAKNAMVEAAGDDESAVLAAQEQSLSRKVRDIRY